MLLLASKRASVETETVAEPDAAATDDTTGPDIGATETLPLDQIFEILKNQRRRHVIRYLNEREGPVSLSDLAEQIAAWENDKPVSQVTSKERKRVYVGLYQCHLPKMDDVDIIEFNKPRGVIELGENAEIFDRYLDTIDDETEPDWHRYYAIAAALSIFAIASGTTIAAVAPEVPAVEFAAVFTVGLFSLCSLVQFRWIKRQEREI